MYPHPYRSGGLREGDNPSRIIQRRPPLQMAGNIGYVPIPPYPPQATSDRMLLDPLFLLQAPYGGQTANTHATATPSKKPDGADRLAADKAIDATERTISVIVGTSPDRKTFHVHASVLQRSSEYMRSKAKPEWSRGSATVDLSHQDATAFNIYINWLYQSQIVSATDENPRTEWMGLVRAFALGEELIDQAFKNAVMSALSATAHGSQVEDVLPFLVEMVLIIYDATPEKSPARFFLVDVGKSVEKEQLRKLRGELPHDFIFDLAVAQATHDTPTRIGDKRKFQSISTVAHNVQAYQR
ncbi:hypothetical protein CLAFUW4_12677 [Fulvia fulva]|nr:hypothetical protein CLAFUR4_12682 [Fulvia fulva]WPV20978.1 hypothetical protein CLAFUW4_12677 [Fulvia fulva]